MIDRDTYSVSGKILDTKNKYRSENITILAFSDHYRPNELVDAMHNLTPNTHYGLDIPPAIYKLLVVTDHNRDGFYESNEVIAQKTLDTEYAQKNDMVISNLNMSLSDPFTINRFFKIPVKPVSELKQSIFYPAGTIRTLDDPLFDSKMSSLGMYNPAAFTEKAKTRFYALEEDYSHKIPIIFVHGIDGSARDFEYIVSQLDRTRFKPWFFHYPSGGDLDQLSGLFYDIFLSGKTIPINERIPKIIVAHSMGGLVVRASLNNLQEEAKQPIHFISLASPFGGHPAAAAGEKNGFLVLPSWRDLNPNGEFIANLFQSDIPNTTKHHLLYAYDNPKTVKLGENSDGVVPLSSQLFAPAQQQADKQTGFRASHTGILNNPDVMEYINDTIAVIKPDYSDLHIELFAKGGFDVELDDQYTPRQKYILRNYGKFLQAYALALIDPINEKHRKFLGAVKNDGPPRNYVEKAWARFILDYPNWANM